MNPESPSSVASPDRDSSIGVLGMWHLGSVIAACLAEAQNNVLGVDLDAAVVRDLTNGRPPIAEPGLTELLTGCSSRLRFSADPLALADVSIAWVAFDTPVDEDDNADVDSVLLSAALLLSPLPADSLVIVSSQLPVGSVAQLQRLCAERRGADDLRFACLPENLRLGAALDSFRSPERIVAGVREQRDREQLEVLLHPFCTDIQWMGVESAEMTKHALNGFLATSIAFINEVAAICESVGADAEEVARGLKSERRIGPRAYLAPGGAFAGGTLARDISFLRGLAERHGLSAHVASGVAAGNSAHKHWTRRKLRELLGDGGDEQLALAGRTVAVWGLTYKPGTDTLRRSSAIELCHWLVKAGAHVRAHDPAVSELPAGLADSVALCSGPLEAASGAEALVVCTAWPDYLDVDAESVSSAMARAVIVDPAGWLRGSLGVHPAIHHVRVGSSIGGTTTRDTAVTAPLAHT
jgi:UDPglucose 6-dehydrogenase